ncbi:Semaphorin-6D Precursor [Triplophysa tibetana]|uniref:Semaphorin-6D n=1 Tax=Triplophysa tibetana TaxID=1572043 RepID=A0A5A9NKE0_9TELE|nr:Semaphorin-6D Precursor [Triplophysa tibetana]
MAMISLICLLPVIALATPFPRDLQPIRVVGPEDSHLYPSFQGLMSDNHTQRLGLAYQQMIRIQQLLYIAASTLEQVGQELSGQARCSFESPQSNVGLFAGGHFYSATVTDFQASDAVIYRSLGGEGRPVLRTVKYDSKWLREPHFLHAVEYGNYVYFFFSEIAVEHTAAGKNDSGGSTRVLDRYWTSFLKARLNCSVPGETFFYFDVLQSLTDVLQINRRPAVLGLFTTQINRYTHTHAHSHAHHTHVLIPSVFPSIPGSAVCGFYLDDIERVFNGKFKEQKNSDSVWTSVPEEHVPTPRPGSCAGEGSASSFSSSAQFPDSVLLFIKTHPLMDESVSSVNNHPLITSTVSRYKLTGIVVDTAAGPHKNRTVVFVGSEDGRVLKILTSVQPNSTHSSKLLEDIDVYNPTQCSGERRVLGLELDKENHALFVAFSSCVIRVPLSRCLKHGTCKSRCISTHDPYCIWLRTGRCADVAPGFKAGFEQDIDGDQSQLPDTCAGMMSSAGTDQKSVVDSASGVKQFPDVDSVSGSSYHITLLGVCVLVAFVLGAFVSGLWVSCVCGQRSPRAQEPEETLPHALNSLAKLNRLLDPKPDTGSHIYSSAPPCRQQPIKSHASDGTSGQPVGEELVSTLPTPDSTPELPIKSVKIFNSQWERNLPQSTFTLTQQELPVTQSFSKKQTLPDDDCFKNGQHEVGGDGTTGGHDITVMTSSLLPSTSYYSCLNLPQKTPSETPESTTFHQIPVSRCPSQRHVLIRMGNGVSTTRQHSFNQKAAVPQHQSAHNGNIYETHRALILRDECLIRQHSFIEPPHLQRAAVIRRTASLKPQIPPKPINIPVRALHLPTATDANTTQHC